MNCIKKNGPLAILGAFALVPTLGLAAATASATPALGSGISVSISDSQNPTVPYESSKFAAFASTDCGTITTYHWVGGDDTFNPHDGVSARL
jgi:hypothetical protein